MGAHDAFLKAIQKRRDIDPGGKYDVIAHGTATKIEIIHNNKKIYVNSRTAAKLIRHMDGYKKGQPIRLLSCDTGYLNNGFAQNLANKLGVTVYAPTKKLWESYDAHGRVRKSAASRHASGALRNDSSRFRNIIHDHCVRLSKSAERAACE